MDHPDGSLAVRVGTLSLRGQTVDVEHVSTLQERGGLVRQGLETAGAVADGRVVLGGKLRELVGQVSGHFAVGLGAFYHCLGDLDGLVRECARVVVLAPRQHAFPVHLFPWFSATHLVSG